MGKFKIGDRVRIYDIDPTSSFRAVTDHGDVTQIDKNGERLYISPKFWKAGWYHSKQCRKLVKRPRRMISVYTADLYLSEGSITAITTETPYRPGWTDFVEVKRK